MIYSQTAKRKAYRKWYYAHEPQSFKDARKAYKKTPQGKRCAKNAQLKETYGITLAEYELKLAEQHKRCAICNRHSKTLKKGLHIDHEHATGKIRGLLCMSCNTRLIAAIESPFFKKALAYLKSWD